MQKFKIGEVVIYKNNDSFELGVIKNVVKIEKPNIEYKYFVNYHTGDTAALSSEHCLFKINNLYAFDIKRKKES